MSESFDIRGCTVRLEQGDTGVFLELTRRPNIPMDDSVKFGKYFSQKDKYQEDQFWFIPPYPKPGEDIGGELTKDGPTRDILGEALKKFKSTK